jgi:hypothetical protein
MTKLECGLMIPVRRWAAIMLAAAMAGASLNCPSLGDIGVGAGDAGEDRHRVADVTEREERGRDVATDEARITDAVSEQVACSPDLATDPMNCGRCGHDCVVPEGVPPDGGGCRGGACQPYAIVSGNAGPYGVAVTKGIVYFTSTDNTVEMCMADDCMNTLTEMTSGQSIPRGITTDSTNVYWASEGFIADGGFAGGIATCGLSGCLGGIATLLAPFEQAPYEVVVNANNAYWTDDFGKLVRTCPISGCSQDPTTLVADPEILSGIAVDATSFYWAEPKLGNLIKCPLTGCASFIPFATFTPCDWVQIHIVNDTVFWSAETDILTCPSSGCGGAPQVFASNQATAYAITDDGTNLYWTAEEGGLVLSCPLTGCASPTVLGSEQHAPTSVAVDDTSVYWANSTGSTVMRLMK